VLDLIAKSPAEGLLPITKGDFTLTEENLGFVTSVMPFAGQRAEASEALVAAHGVAFPDPCQVTEADGVACQWTGNGQAFLMGPAPDAALSKSAALTDQSDAWCCVLLEGEGVEDVLARLVPVDLRSQAFAQGCCARTLLQHMTVAIRRSEKGLHIMAFRSMAATLVHEIADAMAGVAARDAAG